MSHKNDSANLTKKSSGLLKDWWSICLSYFFNVSIHGKPQTSIAANFRQSAGYVIGITLVAVTNCTGFS